MGTVCVNGKRRVLITWSLTLALDVFCLSYSYIAVYCLQDTDFIA